MRTLINNCPNGKYNLVLSIKKNDPYKYVKQNAYKPMDYNNGFLRKRFKSVVDDMEKARKDFKIPIFLGYSNYTFELWMLLHVTDMSSAVANRQSYLKHVNKCFNKKYQGLDEYKKEDEFRAILRKYITIDSVFAAIDRADMIHKQKKLCNQRCEHYKNIEIYLDNPYTTVHQVAAQLLSMCGVSRQVR